MSDIEDEVRRYAQALTRAVAPVDRSELDARRRRRNRSRTPLLTGVAAALCAVVVAALVIVVPGHHNGSVDTTASTARAAGTTAPQQPCPASTMAVTSTQGERLHPDFLPAGFVLTEGSETALGTRGQLTYTTPGGGDPPRVELLRYLTQSALTGLIGTGSHHPVTVQGHPAVIGDGAPAPAFRVVAWNTAPGVALAVSAYKLSEAVMLEIANGVRYTAGTTITYAARPSVRVTRAEALARLGGPAGARHAVLTSIGEVDAIASPTGVLNRTPTIAPALDPATAVWVAWTTSSELKSKPPRRALVVIAAQSGARFDASASFAGVGALTDRSRAGCAPPFGVLTRSEIGFLRPAEMHATQTATLTTLGQLIRADVNTLSACALASCDPDVPVWVLIDTAPDSRFLGLERGPALAPRPTSAVPGSWTVTAYDARTGPQSSAASNAGVEIGAGRPPAALVALTDLAPG